MVECAFDGVLSAHAQLVECMLDKAVHFRIAIV